jgi:SAM-dependent methyltransferase
MKEAFEKIYKNKTWQRGNGPMSGPGSSVECSKPYLDFIQEFCAIRNVRSILDLGCGDFNLMQHFNFDKIDHYLGIDIVQSVIDQNTNNFGKHNVEFVCNSILEYVPTKQFDLVLCKDVCQHLFPTNVQKLLHVVGNQKLCLFTNDISESVNGIILDGDYTPVDLSTPPYNMIGEYVFAWQSCTFYKKTFKIEL